VAQNRVRKPPNSRRKRAVNRLTCRAISASAELLVVLFYTSARQLSADECVYHTISSADAEIARHASRFTRSTRIRRLSNAISDTSGIAVYGRPKIRRVQAPHNATQCQSSLLLSIPQTSHHRGSARMVGCGPDGRRVTVER